MDDRWMEGQIHSMAQQPAALQAQTQMTRFHLEPEGRF